MSLFCTAIPVDIDTLKKSLPGKAFLHSLTWDPLRNAIIAVWEDEQLESGRSVAIEFPLQELTARVLPRGVRKTNGPAARPDRTKLQPPAYIGSWKHPGNKLNPEMVGSAQTDVATKAGTGVEAAKPKKVKGKERSAQ